MSAGAGFFGSEFFAALVGAVVGGLFAPGLQLLNFQDQERRRRESARQATREREATKRETELILAFSILRKLSRAHTVITDIRNHLHEGMLTSLRDKIQYALAVKAFSTDPEKVTFSDDELLLIKSLRNDDALNHSMDLPGVHAMYIDNMALARTIRNEWAELVDENDIQIDGRAVSKFTGAKAAVAKYKLYTRQNMLIILYGHSFYDYPMITNLFYDLQEGFKNKFGLTELGFVWQVERMKGTPPPPRRKPPGGA